MYAKDLPGLRLSNVLSLYRFECVIRPQVVGILVHKVKTRSQKGGLTPLPVMMVPPNGQHVVTGV